MSQEEGTKLRESVPYVKIYRYNPKHLLLRFRNKTQRITPSYFTSHRYRYKLRSIDPWSEINSWILHILPYPDQPPGGWPAGSGGPEQFRLPYGVQPFSWPRLSPPSALPPGPSSTCVWGGDPLRGGRCLLFGPSLTSPLVERLHGRILAPWDIPSPTVSKSRRPFSWSSGVSSWGYPPFVALLWRATLSVLNHRGNAPVLMHPRCLVLWALNSGRLRCWLEWWPTLRPWPVTAQTLSLGIFLWCQSFFPTILSTKPPWERWISTWCHTGQWGDRF